MTFDVKIFFVSLGGITKTYQPWGSWCQDAWGQAVYITYLALKTSVCLFADNKITSLLSFHLLWFKTEHVGFISHTFSRRYIYYIFAINIRQSGEANIVIKNYLGVLINSLMLSQVLLALNGKIQWVRLKMK